MAIDVGAELAEAIGGDKILVPQIDQEGEEALPVLHGGGDVGREGRGHVGIAERAMLGFSAMLGDDERLGRQIEDLSADMAGRGLIVELGSTPIGTDVEGEGDGLVGMFHGLEGMAGVPRLAPRLAPGLFP